MSIAKKAAQFQALYDAHNSHITLQILMFCCFFHFVLLVNLIFLNYLLLIFIVVYYVPLY